MDSIILFRGPETSESLENPFPGSKSGCVAFQIAPMSSGSGTAPELAWELIDIFENGMFAFPVYDHDSARDIVRYLLERGILEEELADAIKDSTVDMNIWLEKGDKYMVGEWVIAWINACREDYFRRKNAHGSVTVVGYHSRRKIMGSLDGSTDSLRRHYSHMDDDDDDGNDDDNCPQWGGLREDGSPEEEKEDNGQNYQGIELCSTGSSSFRGVPSYSSGLSFGQATAIDDSNDDLNTTVKWSSSSPSSPPTPFHRLAPFLRRTDHHHHHHQHQGAASTGSRRKHLCWRSVTSPSLKQLFHQTADEKSDSGIVSDFFEPASFDDDDDDEKEEEEELMADSVALQKSSICNNVVVDHHSCGAQCSCKLPHYARYQSDIERCLKCGKEKNSDCHATEGLTTFQGQGQYYKDFIIRALEYTLETLDREGPGYLFVLTDSEDRPVTWTHDKRYRVSSSNRPELCLAAYRSRNIDVDLLWQFKVSNHNKVTSDVQAMLEKHRLHSNWFKCTLNTVMETFYTVISRHQTTTASGCQTDEP